jgi:ribosomal protein S18 acetylase RimI-like enzyme
MVEQKQPVQAEVSPEKAGEILYEEPNRKVKIKEADTKNKTEILGHLVLRCATPGDFEGIAKVAIDRWNFREKKYKEPQAEEQLKKKGLGQIKETLAEPGKIDFLVLTVNGEVAGYIEFGKNPDDRKYRSDDATAHIYTLSVLEKYMNNGFATALLKCGIEQAEKCFNAESIYLNTQEENGEAVPLYKEKFGFEQIGESRLNESKKWHNEKTGKMEPVHEISLVLDVKKWKEKLVK